MAQQNHGTQDRAQLSIIFQCIRGIRTRKPETTPGTAPERRSGKLEPLLRKVDKVARDRDQVSS